MAKGYIFLRFKKDFICLFLEREEEREKERKRNINVFLPLACPLLGTWPATQACALTENQTSNPLVHRLALNPLSYTSQGLLFFFFFKLRIHVEETGRQYIRAVNSTYLGLNSGQVTLG